MLGPKTKANGTIFSIRRCPFHFLCTDASKKKFVKNCISIRCQKSEKYIEDPLRYVIERDVLFKGQRIEIHYQRKTNKGNKMSLF